MTDANAEENLETEKNIIRLLRYAAMSPFYCREAGGGQEIERFLCSSRCRRIAYIPNKRALKRYDNGFGSVVCLQHSTIRAATQAEMEAARSGKIPLAKDIFASEKKIEPRPLVPNTNARDYQIAGIIDATRPGSAI